MAPNEFVRLTGSLLLTCGYLVNSQLACMDGSPVMNRKVEFNISSRKNLTGHWITSYTLNNESPRLPNNWKVNIEHSFSCSNGLQKFQLLGTVVVPPPIPPDYTLYPGVGYYKKHPISVGGFDEAVNTCFKEGAHLAIINSEAERNVINSLVKEGVIYLGFHDRIKEGEFITVLGEPLNTTGFTEWLPAEPNNVGGHEHCGTYHISQGYNDDRCDKQLLFVCEFQLAWGQ